MATTYTTTATITAGTDARQIRADELGRATDRTNHQYSLSLVAGVDDNQIDGLKRETNTMGGAGDPSATLPVYLETGLGNAFTDGFGNPRQFATIRTVMIENMSDDEDDILTTQNSNFDGVPDGIEIHPGGVFLITHPGAGWDIPGDCGFELQNSNVVNHAFKVKVTITGVRAS